jgi:hypothetical protein
MISANYDPDATSACKQALEDSIIALDNESIFGESYVLFLKDQIRFAYEEETVSRMLQCNLDECSPAQFPIKPCTNCTQCEAAAITYGYLVKNFQPCTDACSVGAEQSQDVQLVLVAHKSKLDSMNDAMEACNDPESDLDDDARTSCVENELMTAAGNPSPAEFEKLRTAAAANAIEQTMLDCGNQAGGDTAKLKECSQNAAKITAMTTLGLSTDKVTPVLVNTLMQSAAKSRVTSVMANCMEEANGDPVAENSCASSTYLKDNLATMLGVNSDSITSGTVQEFVVAAATDLATNVLDACMQQATTMPDDLQQEYKDNCRSSTACVSLAASLGRAADALSPQQCQEMLQEADLKQVQTMIKACIASIDEADPVAAQEQKCLCKDNIAKPALAQLQGRDPDSISNQEMQRYVLDTAMSQTMPAAMKACTAVVNSDDSLSETQKVSARNACRQTSGRAAYIEAMCREPTETELGTLITNGAATRVKEALSACNSIPLAEKPACQNNAKNAAASANGQSSISALDYNELQKGGAIQGVLIAAKACEVVGVATCDLVAAYSAHSTFQAPTHMNMKTINNANAVEAAKSYVKSSLQACIDKSNTELRRTCATDLTLVLFQTLVSIDRVDAVVRDALRQLAIEQMRACTASGALYDDCRTAAKEFWQSFSADQITDKEFGDAEVIGRMQMYNTAVGSSTGISCDGDAATCLQQATSDAANSGGSANAMTIEIAFNALRQAANTLSNCELLQSACLVEARDEYETVGGNPAEWQAVQGKVIEIASAYSDGYLTTIQWLDSIDMTFTFDSTCSDTLRTEVTDNLDTQTAAICPACTAAESSAPFNMPDSTCQLKYRVSIPAGYSTTLAARFGEIVITASGRRSSSTASTGSGQTVTECAQCTAPPTTAPATQSQTYSYLLKLDPELFNEASEDGQNMRGVIIEGFAFAAELAESEVTIADLKGLERRASSTLIDFATSGTVSTNFAETMTNGGFAAKVIELAAAYGITITMFNVELYTGATSDAVTTQSSGGFDVWFYVIIGASSCIFIGMVVLGFIAFNKYQAASKRIPEGEYLGDSPRNEMLLMLDHDEDMPTMGTSTVGIDPQPGNFGGSDSVGLDDIQLESMGVRYEKYAPA